MSFCASSSTRKISSYTIAFNARPLYGIALISRYPVLRWQITRLPAAPIRSPVYVPKAGLLLLKDEPRVLLAAVVETPRGPVTVATTHLSFVPGWNVRQLRAAVDLRPAGQPGTDGEALPLPLGVPLDLVAERRPRPDHRHLAAHDVPELRQLVDRGSAEQAPDACDACVAAIDRGIDDHRALEDLAQEAHAPIDLTQALLAVDVLGVLGAIALGRGVASPVGELWNEVPDRVSDTAVLVGVGLAANDLALGLTAALAALATAYVRTAARVAGAPADFGGPMAKQHRMALVTALALWQGLAPTAWNPGGGLAPWWALALIAVLSLLTVALRLARAARALRSP